VICVHDEEARLEACLRRLSFADEIVVVLDRCTDGSEAIARDYAHTVIKGAYPQEGARKAAALAAAKGEWIIEVDADEQISVALAAEIRERVNAPGDFTYFQVPVDNYVGQRLVRYGWGGSFGTSSVARLFRRGAKRWGLERIHPTVRFEGERGPSLVNPIRHEVDADISDMINRLDRYTHQRALDLVERGQVGGIADNAFRGFRRFLKCYISRKGYREGGWGVLIAVMAGLYPLLSTLRARLEVRQAREADAALATPRVFLPRIVAGE
jgi:glycosyltransferase involved in cell wall biosynthesis